MTAQRDTSNEAKYPLGNCIFEHGRATIERHSTKETIVAAALRIDGVVWSLPPPTRHHTLNYAWASAHQRKNTTTGEWELARLGEHDSGFLTSTRRFVDRPEAARIAIAAGQITALIAPPNLFSEDLW